MARSASTSPTCASAWSWSTSTAATRGCSSQVFAGAPLVKGLAAPGCAGYTRKQIDELTEFAKKEGAKGLVTLVHDEGGIRAQGAGAKFSDAEKAGHPRPPAAQSRATCCCSWPTSPAVANETPGRLRAGDGPPAEAGR